MRKELVTINLNYLKDNDNNYIVYRKTNSQPNVALISQMFSHKDILIPTNDSDRIEQELNALAKQNLDSQLANFSLKTQESFSNIKIIGNYIDKDSKNLVYTTDCINKESVDKDNTLYTIGVMSFCSLPLTFKNFLRKPVAFTKAIFKYHFGFLQNFS